MEQTFAQLGISEDLIRGLAEMGIETPTPIQSKTIPLCLPRNKDLVGKAQTGTGKTAAYGLPLLMNLNPAHNAVQALVLCPTRELAQQVAKQLFKFTKYSDKVFIESVYGGEKIDIQINKLSRPTHVIVATPGRLVDLMKRGIVSLNQVKTLVLDEADEMLSMGFRRELDFILKEAQHTQARWLFSATIPPAVKDILNKHISGSAHFIEISPEKSVNPRIAHQYVMAEEDQKLDMLLSFLRAHPDDRGIIFTRTKKASTLLHKQMEARNKTVGLLNGDMKQVEREKVLRGFKNKSLQYVIATDIAARGIDVAGLEFVVHYQMPDQDDYYTHRAGRTARAGQSGVSLVLASKQDLKAIKYLAKKLKISFSQVR